MTATSLSNAVNPHYLCKVMDLSELMPVRASAAIVDAFGSTLVAQGAIVTRQLQERLLTRKLRRPLERALCIDGGVDSAVLHTFATTLIDANRPLARILRASATGGRAPLALLGEFELGEAMRLLLTLSERDGTLTHALTVSLLSICLAKQLRLTEQDQIVAGLAGLLHDIGELYVDPAFLVPGRRLQPQQWAEMVSHPHTGQLLINELESFPLAVGRAVAEHHERFDGSGYPRQALGNHISAPGQAVAVAELVASLLGQERALEHAELALSLIPGEHPSDLQGAVAGALRLQQRANDDAPASGAPANESAERLGWRIASSLELGQRLLDGPAAQAQATRAPLERALGRIKRLQHAYIDTTVDGYLVLQVPASASVRRAPASVATMEIGWRLRDIARDLALRSALQESTSVFAGLIDLLDDDDAPQRAITAAAQSASPAPASSAGSRPAPA